MKLLLGPIIIASFTILAILDVPCLWNEGLKTQERMSKATVLEFFENIVCGMIEVIQDTADMAGQGLPVCLCLFVFQFEHYWLRIVALVC